MQFRIADTFTDSLAKLTGDEQTLAKNAAFDLQMNPAHPGLQFHRLDKAKDKNFWSIRAGRDVRLIVHKSNANFLLCFVGHHDKSYAWAERRKLERHPKTGAAQLVEIRETVREIQVPSYVVSTPKPKPAVFANIGEDELLGYGVPDDWLEDAKSADEDSLLELVDHLPKEAAEALLTLATGGRPETNIVSDDGADPFEHPDAKRRFRLLADNEELQRALEYPWDKWIVFLHPDQRSLVERDFSGPARVAGSAGTGKTIVALHRAVELAKSNQDSLVLLTTFSERLANSLKLKLKCLIDDEGSVINRIEVGPIEQVAINLFSKNHGLPSVATSQQITDVLSQVMNQVDGHKFSLQFLLSEWTDVVDAWQLNSWESYKDVKRLGRKTRLGEKSAQIAWQIFEIARDALADQDLTTLPNIYAKLADEIKATQAYPFTSVVVDEAQDIGVPQLRFVAALTGSEKNNLFFSGDLGQRIFQTPFSWKSLGVDVRGRSSSLKINYRTSHQIRKQADLLLPPQIADVDGILENRQHTISAFNGPEPELFSEKNEHSEAQRVGNWLTSRIGEGVLPGEICVIVRTEDQFDRAKRALEIAGLHHSTDMHQNNESVSIVTMHLAKGLEFRCIAVMACDDDLIPLESRIASVADQGDLEDVYNTERHLLYVACTRARDQLLITGVEPVSEFLDDLGL